MGTIVNEQEVIKTFLGITPDIVKLPISQVWADYDKEADVLYLSFRRPQRAKKTEEIGDDILVRKDGKEIVGITILNARDKKRLMADGSWLVGHSSQILAHSTTCFFRRGLPSPELGNRGFIFFPAA
jgi:uncharacterized protein YuzE